MLRILSDRRNAIGVDSVCAEGRGGDAVLQEAWGASKERADIHTEMEEKAEKGLDSTSDNGYYVNYRIWPLDEDCERS